MPERRTEMSGRGTRMRFDVTRAFSVGAREFGSRWSGASHQLRSTGPRPLARLSPARSQPDRPGHMMAVVLATGLTSEGDRVLGDPRVSPERGKWWWPASARWRTGIRDRPDERRLEERRVSCVKPSPRRSSLFFACRSRQLVVTTRRARTLWTRPRQSQVGRDQSRRPVQPKGMSATSPAAPRSQPVMTR